MALHAVQKYNDAEMNRLMSAVVSQGIRSHEEIREHAKSKKNARALGVKANNKTALIGAHRKEMARYVDKCLAELETHLDSYTSKLLEQRFEDQPMPAPEFDVNWVSVIARPNVASQVFGAKADDADDIRQAKLIVAPILQSIHNVAAKSQQRKMRPMYVGN